MSLRRPDDLVLDYLQRMMAWLLFLSPPGHILQLGLGAGSLTRFSLRHFKSSRVTVVERSDAVIRAAHQWFQLPAAVSRLRVLNADAGLYLREGEAACTAGVIQVDLYDAMAKGPVLDSVEFYRDCHAALDPPGILVVNLFGHRPSFQRSLAALRQVFSGRVLALAPVAAGNRIVLAFKGPPFSAAVDEGLLQQRAHWVGRHYGLPDAFMWVRQMPKASHPDHRGALP